MTLIEVNKNSNKTNVYSVQLGEEPNLRLQIGLNLRVGEGVIDLPPIK